MFIRKTLTICKLLPTATIKSFSSYFPQLSLWYLLTLLSNWILTSDFKRRKKLLVTWAFFSCLHLNLCYLWDVTNRDFFLLLQSNSLDLFLPCRFFEFTCPTIRRMYWTSIEHAKTFVIVFIRLEWYRQTWIFFFLFLRLFFLDTWLCPIEGFKVVLCL